MKLYAGIGSRETPDDILREFTDIASRLQARGYTLRSGGAKGADKAFESGVSGYECEIFYAGGYIPKWCDVFTEHFHPAPGRLSEYPRRLMNRNAMQILGVDGDTPVDFVVCWTKGGKKVGGTRQAIEIAEYFGIPVYNFGDPTQRELFYDVYG